MTFESKAEKILQLIRDCNDEEIFGTVGGGVCSGIECNFSCPMYYKHKLTIKQSKEYLMSVINKFVEGEEVYVSNVSQEDADKATSQHNKRIYVSSTKDGRHICVQSASNADYRQGRNFNAHAYLYASKVSDFKEVTMAEIEKKFGCRIRIKG